jgi:hypothetical protein
MSAEFSIPDGLTEVRADLPFLAKIIRATKSGRSYFFEGLKFDQENRLHIRLLFAYNVASKFGERESHVRASAWQSRTHIQ